MLIRFFCLTSRKLTQHSFNGTVSTSCSRSMPITMKKPSNTSIQSELPLTRHPPIPLRPSIKETFRCSRSEMKTTRSATLAVMGEASTPVRPSEESGRGWCSWKAIWMTSESLSREDSASAREEARRRAKERSQFWLHRQYYQDWSDFVRPSWRTRGEFKIYSTT